VTIVAAITAFTVFFRLENELNPAKGVHRSPPSATLATAFIASPLGHSDDAPNGALDRPSRR
jgi:hypothetical protein